MSIKTKILLGMLVFVPIAMGAQWLHLNPLIVFLVSGLAIIPLAAWIANSTEEIATVIGPAFGGLLNATFGNATEMIIAIVALRSGLVEVVKASITGSIIANLLLAIGLSTLLGGIRFSEQKFQPTVARLNSSSLILAVIVMVTPTIMHETSAGLKPEILNYFSYAAAVLLLLFYCLMLYFSMKTHRSLYQLEELESEAHGAPEAAAHPTINLKLQLGVLLGATIVLVFISDILVESLQETIKTVGLSPLFTGVILIPLFGGVVEYITCITFALKNKMEVAMAVAIGSSLQIALFVAPILVLVGWLMGQPMNLDFNPFEIVAVAMAVIICNSISSDGSSNWLEGVLLLITYIILGTAFYFHP
ncbi:cation transporter [Neosynechococcus sphagnicola sy1]|uniref:Ca(2+)/H(+) antiporter n=1 Tax=Neosynechococcus sphagnicola sy1 TaxID=1497020 RepID=A0A098TMI8_9CYAN|nr:calcium/proton exchanger [Neosynechococcus sphagnicola]KGF72058.1 cation transporter [Neosynechococcus sphagnicola sy1]